MEKGKNMKDTIRLTQENKPMMIAHRGMSGLEMENTASAFVAAGQRSHFGIETDVHRTADGEFIVIHDDNTKRVAGDEMIAEQTSYRTLRSLRLLDTGDYGKKLVCGLKRTGFLLLWSAPLLALAVLFRIHFSGEVDGFTVLRMIKNDLGGGDQMRGILVVALMLLATLLLVALGCAFHSGARHAWVRNRPGLVRGRHGRVMLAWGASLLSILPMLLAILAVILRYLPVLSDLNGLLMNTVSLPSTRGTGIILGVGALLTVPLLPLRSLIPAAFVAGLEERA